MLGIKGTRDKTKFTLLFLALLIAGLFYVGNTWSPSSYGIVLTKIGAHGEGLILGTPKPIRSDEWAIHTPQVQATVRNHYQRINHTSYYHEDLRQYDSLPIHDWGLIFKPMYWGFLFLSPAYAYSLYWYLCFALFIAGYTLLFYRYKVATLGLAIGVSVLLYFSGFVQAYWTMYEMNLSLFPWVLLAITELSSQNWLTRMLLVYWVTACWLICFFYPPFFISLGFVGLVLVLACRKELINRKWLANTVFACGTAIATALFYLKDYLLVIRHTIYPGMRSVSGGTETLRDWVTVYIPSINLTPSIFPLKDNICEAATTGSYLLLILLFSLNYHALSRKIIADLKQQKMSVEILLIISLAVMFFWMYLPIPKEIGALFLLDRIPPKRLTFAAGIMNFFALLYFYKQYGAKFTSVRWLAMASIVLLMLLIYKIDSIIYWGLEYIVTDVIFIVFCLIMAVTRNTEKALIKCVSMAVILQFLLFGFFNPIQSTKPMFNIPHTLKMQRLEVLHKKNGWLNEEGYVGSILNGLGFMSKSHLLGMPKLQFWQKQYPELPADEINWMFNRYTNIVVDQNLLQPILTHEQLVLIPQKADMKNRFSYVVLPLNQSPCKIKVCANGGKVEIVMRRSVEFSNSDRISIPATGYIQVQGIINNTHVNKLIIVSDVKIKFLQLSKLNNSEFKMMLWVDKDKLKDIEHVCVLYPDGRKFRRLMPC